jgi:hypothetical protein
MASSSLQWYHRPGWIWRARYRGYDTGHQMGTRAERAFPRHLPRIPARSGRVGPQRLRPPRSAIPSPTNPPSSDHIDFSSGAKSTEFAADPVDPIIIFMPEISRTHMGGTMRLGLRPTVFQQDSEWSRIRKLYGGTGTVWERHRHRYEVNPNYVERLHTSGLAFIGRDEKGERMQIMELPSAPHTLSFSTTS